MERESFNWNARTKKSQTVLKLKLHDAWITFVLAYFPTPLSFRWQVNADKSFWGSISFTIRQRVEPAKKMRHLLRFCH